MAVLSNADRAECWADWMAENREPTAANKATHRAVVNAIDDWLESNLPGLNAAINAAGGNSLTIRQKYDLLWRVLLRRIRRA